MGLLKDYELAQSNFQSFQAVLDIREQLGNGKVKLRMKMLALLETFLAEQLLVAVYTTFFLADEVDIILTAGARCCVFFEELFLFLRGRLGLHVCFVY